MKNLKDLQNMGMLDRSIRIFFIISIIVFYFTVNITDLAATLLLAALALIFSLTTISGICPIYLLFGVSSKIKK